MLLVDRKPAPEVTVAGLGLVAKSHTLRCDVKQAEERYYKFDEWIERRPYFWINDVLPGQIYKGTQPKYLDQRDEDAVPVISTICIQNLEIVDSACRQISEEEYEAIEADRKPRAGDVLLTVDGGTSIGKPVLFKHEDDYAVDSHVAILRPKGIAPGLLVYLLASPIGQLQFQRAESGASGQTAVTEDDIRRFRFPSLDPKEAEVAVAEMRHTMERIAELQGEISRTEREGWERFESRLDGA